MSSLTEFLENPAVAWSVSGFLGTVLAYNLVSTRDGSETRRSRVARRLQDMSVAAALSLGVLYFVRRISNLKASAFEGAWLDFSEDEFSRQNYGLSRVQNITDLFFGIEHLRVIVSDLIRRPYLKRFAESRADLGRILLFLDDLTVRRTELEQALAVGRRLSGKRHSEDLPMFAAWARRGVVVPATEETWNEIGRAIIDPLLAKLEYRDRFTSCYTSDVVSELAREFLDIAGPVVAALTKLLMSHDRFKRHAAAQALYLIGPAARSKVDELEAAAELFSKESAGAIAKRLVQRLHDSETRGESNLADRK